MNHLLCVSRLEADEFVPYTAVIFHDGCNISETLSGFNDLKKDTSSALGIEK